MLLALDCSFAGLSLALVPQEAQKAHVFTTPQARSSDALHLELQKLLAQSNTSMAEVSTIALTVGPGSFTGCRIGLAVAQAIQLVHQNVKIIGLSTLQALACQMVQENDVKQNFTVLLSAAGADVFAQTFTPQAQPLTQATCLPLTQAFEEAKQNGETAAPASLLLPRPATYTFTTLNPLILAEMSHNPAWHLPIQPLYIKPLTYRKVGE